MLTTHDSVEILIFVTGVTVDIQPGSYILQ
jgi:hypothetical protein